MLDLSWITDDLAVGGAPPTDDFASLAETHGVRRVVDLRAEACDEHEVLLQHGIKLLALPTADFGAVTPQMIEDGVRWIESARLGGERTLVHCQLGIGRSVLLVLCALVARGSTAPEAMLLVKDRRAQASPSPQQLEALLDWEEKVSGHRSEWRDVARHAYRHLPEWRNA